MSPRENGFVIGYPGSGKTQVLVHRAAYLVESQGIFPPKIKLFVFTDVMERLAESAIISLDLPKEMVTTFDRWCHCFYVGHISRDLPRMYLDGRVDHTKVCYDRLSELVGQRQSMEEIVGILVPTDSLVHRLAKALRDRGIETEKAIALDAQNVIHNPYDLGNNLPKITTYRMASGMTFDSVLMPQLTENTFAKVPSSLRRRLLFVGITRASSWIHLSTVKGQEFREIAVLKLAEKEEHLKILNKLSPIL